MCGALASCALVLACGGGGEATDAGLDTRRRRARAARRRGLGRRGRVDRRARRSLCRAARAVPAHADRRLHGRTAAHVGQGDHRELHRRRREPHRPLAAAGRHHHADVVVDRVDGRVLRAAERAVHRARNERRSRRVERDRTDVARRHGRRKQIDRRVVHPVAHHVGRVSTAGRSDDLRDLFSVGHEHLVRSGQELPELRRVSLLGDVLAPRRRHARRLVRDRAALPRASRSSRRRRATSSSKRRPTRAPENSRAG